MLTKHVLKQGCQTFPTVVLKHKLLGPIHSLCRSEWAWESDFWKALRFSDAGPTPLRAPGVEHLCCYPNLRIFYMFLLKYVSTFRTNRPVLPGGRTKGKDTGTILFFTIIVLNTGMAFKARVQYLIHLPACKPDEGWLWMNIHSKDRKDIAGFISCLERKIREGTMQPRQAGATQPRACHFLILLEGQVTQYYQHI